QHVELLLHFAVHVAARRRAQAVAERALVDARADRLAGAGDGLDQQAQVGIDQLLVALPLDQELGQVDTSHGQAFYVSRSGRMIEALSAATTRNPIHSS